MHRNREMNREVRQNPAAENTAAPSPLPKNEQAMNRNAPSKGNPLSIPSTRGYAGQRIK